MTTDPTSPVPRAPENGGSVVISVDAMGGDRGPSVVVAGMAESAAKNPEIRFVVHGDEAQLRRLIARRKELSGRCDIRHMTGVVTMEDKPSQIVRKGNGTSMWSAIESVKTGEAGAAVSCGNTGALMALSMLRLRKLPGVNRPAIACLWPSKNPGGFNIMLDVGADIRADAPDLLQYALMGASYARNGMDIAEPRIGLLNVGTEEHKGRAELKQANELISAAAEAGNFRYVGFVEGGDLPSSRVDVIVTDGFTGNIALKTGEGTAKLVGEFLRQAFANSIMSKFAALLAMTSLKRLQKRIDPRRVNGGIFLGLNGTVIKSHGSADATGVSAAIKLAFQLTKSGFQDRLAARVAQSAATLPSGTESEGAAS
ncbi:phosphate acyltransferase PlsX [Paracoccus methylarcula]|uniref:Phosphate acyltransferase n=1 Tax=Paracoccus methylarcula TaxID=72022 RepID=A0A3R7NDE7_9RHOB|nr:phosphate acyltransferase PlsX [Paracoccus methylarcula]RNF35541.1 phosphate acyltransferase PlsX [Paracoccus methylarcula]